MTTLVRAPDTYGYTVFCDDIRQENNNKRIYIGVYQGVMNVFNPPPTNLFKLSLAVHYYEKPGEIEPVEIVITVPGLDQPAFRAVVPAEARAAVKPPQLEEGIDPDDARIGIIFDLNLSPVPLKTEG